MIISLINYIDKKHKYVIQNLTNNILYSEFLLKIVT